MRRRVAVLVRKGLVVLKEEELPSLKEHQVLIKVEACGICTGDIYAFLGYPVWFELPSPIGHEAVGIVVKRGTKVSRVEVGDRVMVLGSPGFSDYMIVEESFIERVPEGIAPEYALGEPLACVVNGVRLANPLFGDHVAVVGTGFMGLLLVQALSRMGLGMLIGVDVRDERLKLAKEFGADVVINPRREDAVERVKELTSGRMCDIVIEATGNPKGVMLAAQLLKKRGRLCIFSYHPNPVSVDFKIWDSKGLEVVMTNPARAEDMRRNLRIAAVMLRKKVFDLTRLITHRWRLERIQEAFEYASKKPRDYIKGVIIP